MFLFLFISLCLPTETNEQEISITISKSRNPVAVQGWTGQKIEGTITQKVDAHRMLSMWSNSTLLPIKVREKCGKVCIRIELSLE